MFYLFLTVDHGVSAQEVVTKVGVAPSHATRNAKRSATKNATRTEIRNVKKTAIRIAKRIVIKSAARRNHIARTKKKMNERIM